ncbi:MAG: cytochrome P450 [Pseudonocardiaceae bacterium]
MSASEVDADFYWPLDDNTVFDPYPAYAKLREAGPVLWHKTMRCWLVTSREHAVEVLSDSATYARDWRRAGAEVAEDRLSVQNLDPPEAVPVRRACRRFLDHADVRAQLTAGIGSFLEERLELAAPNAEFDLLAEVVSPVGRELVARFLGRGVTPQPNDLADLVDGITSGMDAGLDPDRHGEAERRRAAFNGVVARAMSGTPRRELLSRLLHEFDESRVSGAVAFNSVRVVVLSLYAAVTGAIANVAHTLLKLPGETAADVLGAAKKGSVDELLRFDNVVQATTRVAIHTTTLAGQTICAGEDVTVMLGAANRDPAAFSNSDAVCPQRSHNPHLSFSHGAHLCLGPDLGRAIVATALNALGNPRFVLESAGPPSYLPTATMRRINVLPVRVRSAQP